MNCAFDGGDIYWSAGGIRNFIGPSVQIRDLVVKGSELLPHVRQPRCEGEGRIEVAKAGVICLDQRCSFLWTVPLDFEVVRKYEQLPNVRGTSLLRCR